MNFQFSIFNFQLTKNSLSICFLFLLQQLTAQENISSYSLIDDGGVLSTSIEENATFSNLTDKNNLTSYTVENFTGGRDAWIQYVSPSPVVVTAVSLVSSDNQDMDPGVIDFQYSDNGTSWSSAFSLRTITFPGRNMALTNTTGLTTSSQAHRYFRLIIRNTQGRTSLSLAEMQLLGYPAEFATNLTSNGGILTGEYPGLAAFDELLANVTDNSMKKFCQTGTKSFWIQYQSEEPAGLYSYSLMTAGDNPGRNPRSWDLLASNDGIDWDLLDVQRNKNFFDAPYNRQLYVINPASRNLSWSNFAQDAQETLTEQYWITSDNYYLETNTPVHTGFNYWWMAHAMDVLVDGYLRTNDRAYRTQMGDLRAGIYKKNGNKMRNNFYDDMEWMALAFLRVHESTNGYFSWAKTDAISLWNWIEAGWTDVKNGGIMWEVNSPQSKNACSNGPAMVLAARLYNLTGEQKYKDWAIRIFDWMDQYMVDPQNGLVWDSYDQHDYNWTLTYNQGTWIGGCLELYKITKDEKYLQRATRTADYVINDYEKFSPYGILYNNEGGKDGGLFKGIFIRYFADLIESGVLDATRQQEYTQYLVDCGTSLWNTATFFPEIIFNTQWTERPTSISCDCSIHLSGIMLFEMLDKLQRKDLLSGRNPEIAANALNKYKYFRLEMKANNSSNDSQLAEWQLFPVNQSIIHMEKSGPCDIYASGSSVFLRNSTGQQYPFVINNILGVRQTSGILQEHTVESIYLPSGMYVVTIAGHGQRYSRKILVK